MTNKRVIGKTCHEKYKAKQENKKIFKSLLTNHFQRYRDLNKECL